MDKNHRHYYEQELRFLRELGAEFARKFPKVAGRLGISEHANDDPHVERLFQGFAFLAGHVQQRLEREFPAFTETLLEQVYGHLLKPTPSMVVLAFQPTANDSSLTSGVTIPRGTELRARSSLASGSACQYRTGHDVQLWPIAIESVEYTSVLHSIADMRVPARAPIQALLRIGLRVTGGRPFEELQLRTLPIYVNGADAVSARLYEAMVAHASTLVMRWGNGRADHAFCDEAQATRQLGFNTEHALLPAVPNAFRGYRLLHEYFAFPTRFHNVELCGLSTAIKRCRSERLEVILPLKQYDPELEGTLEPGRLRLFATPAVNLFTRRCDIAPVRGSTQDFQLLVDRTQPHEFEVHTVTRVAAFDSGHEAPREYRPLQMVHGRLSGEDTAHYAIERRQRTLAYDERSKGLRTGYAGSEVFLRLSEPTRAAPPFGTKQLAVDALCTNGDLPLLLTRDRNSYFTLARGAPVDSVQCLVGPSEPRSVPVDGDTGWRLVSHLSLNYLSLCEETGGSEALRELLAVYARFGDPLLRREIDGLRSVSTRAVIGPYPEPGPHRFVRGLEVELTCEEQAFAHGALPLASVLSVLFAKHVYPHSFAQTVLRTLEHGEVHRLPALPGVRHAL